MEKKHKARRVLLGGDVVKTNLPPKYILGKYDKKNGVWYYCLKGSIFTKYIDCKTRVIVSRYTSEQVTDKLETQRQFAEPGSLYAELKRFKFRNFARTIGPVVELKVIDSVEQWLDYLENELINDEFKLDKLREILARKAISYGL